MESNKINQISTIKTVFLLTVGRLLECQFLCGEFGFVLSFRFFCFVCFVVVIPFECFSRRRCRIH